MWVYEKRLEFPVNIKTTDAKLATAIMSQLGGPDGEAGAATRYLSQRYSCPYDTVCAVMTDIGTEELNHAEMVCALITQLTRNLTPEQVVEQGFTDYYVDHTTGVWPQAASGEPFSTATLQSTGDVIADLHEDLSAEQKARVTYDNILRITDDPDVKEVIKFLRAREIVHFQRFGEALRISLDKLDEKNFYAFNPSFDKCGSK